MLEVQDVLDRYARPDRSRRWVRANFVASIDGAATRGGRAGPLGDADDQLVLRTLRELADVVVVGAGTVRVEGYGGLGLDDDARARRGELGLSDRPRLAVVSSSLDLAPDAEVFTAPGPRPLVLTHAAAPVRRQEQLAAVADVVVCGSRVVDPHRMLDELTERGLVQILCEGGPQLFGTFLEADLVDELCLTLAPRLEAGTAIRIARSTSTVDRQMRLAGLMHGERMLFLRYERAH